jgi:hypothetical protein
MNDQGMIIERDWVVRKDVTFDDTIMDPVKLHNLSKYCDHSLQSHYWAKEGKATFRDGGYALVVPYNQVEVV